MKQHWPAWYYGPNGERQIFQGEDEVPKGWLTHPQSRPAEEIVAEADLNKDGVIEPSKAEIVKALRAKGVEFDARWSIPRLQALL